MCGTRKWGGAAVFGRTTMLSYPPQADGLNPLHGAHIEDIHPVFAVHCDMGGAATWCGRSRQVSMELRPRPPLGHRSTGQQVEAHSTACGGSRARSHMCLKCAEAPAASTARVYFPHHSKRRSV